MKHFIANNQEKNRNNVSVEVSERLIAKGINLELLPTHQTIGDPELDNQINWFYESYRKSLAHLYQWGINLFVDRCTICGW